MARTVRKPAIVVVISALIGALALAVVTVGIANASGQSVGKDEYCAFLVVSDASIHSRAGAQYPVIGSLSAGQTVTALRRPINRFHLLNLGGYVAAVHLDLLEDPARCG